MKNPEAYQSMIDRYKQSVDTATVKLSESRASVTELTGNLADAKNKISSLEAELSQCKNKPVVECPPCPTPGAAPKGGTVYKIQLGVFKNSDMGAYLSEPKYFGVEKVDEKYRFVVSYFDNKDDAEKFAAEMKKLGIKGAFVSKYDAGERVVETKTPKKAPAGKK